MIDSGNMRWRARRHSYRRPDEPIRTSEYDVVELPDDTTAKRFVVENHYSASFPAARFRFGLYHRDRLVGTAVFGQPCSNKVLTNVFPIDRMLSVELNRFVLLDEVPGNAETWTLARCFELLRGRVRGVVSFSDPVPRQALDGRTVFAGHLGTIYKAFNARFIGRSTPRTLRLLPDGRVFSDRAQQKIRGGERGRTYSGDLLIEFGADPLRPDEDPAEWLTYWKERLTRKMRHPGNYRYAWALPSPDQKTLRRLLDARAHPYPTRAAA